MGIVCKFPGCSDHDVDTTLACRTVPVLFGIKLTLEHLRDSEPDKLVGTKAHNIVNEQIDVLNSLIKKAGVTIDDQTFDITSHSLYSGGGMTLHTVKPNNAITAYLICDEGHGFYYDITCL